MAGLEPATPGFGVRYRPLLLVFSDPVMTVSVEFSRMLGVTDTFQSRAHIRELGILVSAVGYTRPPCRRIHGRTARGHGSLNRSNKTLSTAAVGALVDMMHEARLPRFGLGAGKAHFGPALYALWIFLETLSLALWHSPPPRGC